ncbi:hypothetical protein AMTRI_Chr05g72050 [Amborella trichopoda]
MNLGGMMNGFSIELLNQSNYKIWRIAKAKSILKKFISQNLFDHIVNCKWACDIWISLDGLFNKKDGAGLQLLENELANSPQEISHLVLEEPISEAQMKRHIIRS